MFFILSKTIFYLAMPITWILGLLAYGIFSKNKKRAKKSLKISFILLLTFTNPFLQNEAMHWIITYAGVLIFVGLTAYDTQKIKEMNIIGNEGTDEDTKEAISGALRLYLDFINLFLMLLRIMGDRR